MDLNVLRPAGHIEHSTVLIDDIFSQFLPSVLNLGYAACSSILEVHKVF